MTREAQMTAKPNDAPLGEPHTASRAPQTAFKKRRMASRGNCQKFPPQQREQVAISHV